MIRRIYKARRMRGGKVVESPVYRLRYRLDGDCGKITDVSLHTRDLRVAEEKARRIISESERESVGLLPRRSLRDGATTPLVNHLRDFLADKRQMRRDAHYCHTLDLRLNKLLVECSWTILQDVTADGFQRWRAGQRKAAKTLNDYLGAMSEFLAWLRRHGRLDSDPLAGVGKVDARGQQARERRALTDQECSRLIAVAGPRRALYVTALFTGLRRAELEALCWSDVLLDGPKPLIRVRASTTKNHKSAEIPLHPDVLNVLRSIKPQTCAGADAVFPRMYRMWHFKRDLALAGIPFLDAAGKRADFHALRHTYNTRLAVSGVSPRVAMELMRHSEMRLTTKTYTDVSLLPVAAAVQSLPSLMGLDSSPDSQNLRPDGHSLSQAVTSAPVKGASQPVDGEGISLCLSPSVTDSQDGGIGSGGRARTYNMRINSALLYH